MLRTVDTLCSGLSRSGPAPHTQTVQPHRPRVFFFPYYRLPAGMKTIRFAVGSRRAKNLDYSTPSVISFPFFIYTIRTTASGKMQVLFSSSFFVIIIILSTKRQEMNINIWCSIDGRNAGLCVETALKYLLVFRAVVNQTGYLYEWGRTESSWCSCFTAGDAAAGECGHWYRHGTPSSSLTVWKKQCDQKKGKLLVTPLTEIAWDYRRYIFV